MPRWKRGSKGSPVVIELAGAVALASAVVLFASVAMGAAAAFAVTLQPPTRAEWAGATTAVSCTAATQHSVGTFLFPASDASTAVSIADSTVTTAAAAATLVTTAAAPAILTTPSAAALVGRRGYGKEVTEAEATVVPGTGGGGTVGALHKNAALGDAVAAGESAEAGALMGTCSRACTGLGPGSSPKPDACGRR